MGSNPTVPTLPHLTRTFFVSGAYGNRCTLLGQRITSPTMASEIEALVASWKRDLKARNLADRTVDTYSESASQLTDWLAENEDVDSPGAVTRDHVAGFITHLIETRSASTASVRYRALQQFFNRTCQRQLDRTSRQGPQRHTRTAPHRPATRRSPHPRTRPTAPRRRVRTQRTNRNPLRRICPAAPRHTGGAPLCHRLIGDRLTSSWRLRATQRRPRDRALWGA